jgi:hypothetical protein
MADNLYRLAFDISEASRWSLSDMSLLILPLIGFILIIIPQRYTDFILNYGPVGRAGKVFAISFFLITSAITLNWLWLHYNQVRSIKDLAKGGRVNFVQGCLESFHPMPKGGHDVERIRIEGKEFSYSDFDESSPGFNNTEAHGGPIHPDSKVRIWFFGNIITRVEVRDHACTPATDLTK